MELHMFGTPQLLIGGRFTGVIQLTQVIDSAATIGHRVPTGEAVMLMESHKVCRVSIYDALVLDIDELIYLKLDDDSWFYDAEPNPCGLSNYLLELCGGFGGMGIGASFLGGIPKVTVDNNPLAVQHLNNNHHGQVLQLNLLELKSARQIHEAFQGQPGTTAMGFPRQPHSSQGSMQGSNDARSSVFWAGLRVIFLCQSQTALFECVPSAGRDQDVLRGLQMLANALDCSVYSTELDLQDQWPNRRKR